MSTGQRVRHIGAPLYSGGHGTIIGSLRGWPLIEWDWIPFPTRCNPSDLRVSIMRGTHNA